VEKQNMAGSGLLGWRFKNGMPLWFKLIVTALIANSALHFGLLWTVSLWAQPRRDAAHSYRVPFRDGVNYFAQSGLGWYLDAWWIGVGLLALLVLLLVINRRQLERGL
jgi:hypothetical protein